MPHISKRKLNEKTVRDLENYITSIIKNTGTKTRTSIFGELLTQTEKIMIAKRLGIILLSKKGYSPYKTSKLLGVSTSTVNRFNNGLKMGRYKHTANWLWKQTDKGSRDALIQSLVALAFTGRTKSFKKFVEEY